jgi:hypothetical protein
VLLKIVYICIQSSYIYIYIYIYIYANVGNSLAVPATPQYVRAEASNLCGN